jgi:hypothetical protein
MLNVALGDPGVYSDFKPNPEGLKIVSESVGVYDGYTDPSGMPKIR